MTEAVIVSTARTPIGRARMIVTMIHELRRRGLQFGCVSMCAGGGMGSSLILEVTS
jgi:acetyl-CoA acetyltransferase